MKRASAELEKYVDESVRRSRERGYNPTAFIAMRERYGTIEAAARLVQSGTIQSGFQRLCDLGLVDYTMEATIARKFPAEFSSKVREAAEWRLAQAQPT
ncbi:hypothetical protein [Chelatococcus sp. XZ-Ab1]|uniref:hypothetical protein n=1 Tax=Chelatococcus sp. XZ-Ab1 TaxID=3034027 RepID=UPI0023E376B8|nr:hypothetical protein [Chelatococcus sp. XZ-Ab1]